MKPTIIVIKGKKIRDMMMPPHKKFQGFRYAQTNEDQDLVLKCLNVKPGDKVLGIAAAGDILFNTLFASPATVTGIDLNPEQIGYCMLRKGAFEKLTLKEYERFFGFKKSINRNQTVKRILGNQYNTFSSQYPVVSSLVTKGLLTSSQFSQKIANLYSALLIYLDIEKIDVKQWLKSEDFTFQSPEEMSKGIEPFLVGWEGQIHHMRNMVAGGLKNNPLLFLYLNGLSEEENKPFYLDKNHYASIKSNVGHINFMTTSIQEYVHNTTEKFNVLYLSNVPDYLTESQLKQLGNRLQEILYEGVKCFCFSRAGKRLEELVPGLKQIDSGLDRTRTMGLIYST